MSAMDKAQTNAAWLLAKNCMKSYPVAYRRILAERNALKSELEVADAETQNLRNHAYVLAGNKPFSGQEVLALLNENNELRKAATRLGLGATMNEKGYNNAIYGCMLSIPLFALIYLAVWLIAQFVTP